ncbi:protein kinase [Streptomyces canus]
MQGVLLDERFRIGHRLGAGAMGQVWAAQDERMRRDVAVKVVHPQYGMDEAETQARFQREVQLAGRLAHQNIVTVHDWGEVSVDSRSTLYLVMELVHGVPLHRRLKESTPPWPMAVGWAAQIAEALHAAHGQDVVHRDIKPANALLTPGGTVKVLDFGVAKFMGETIGAHELTVTGTPVGSPSYMSPEQAEGDRAIDHRSDLYSLGCLLYHAVTGQPPFTGSSQWSVLLKQMQGVPEPPSARVEGLPASLNDLILNLLAKRPDDRPADAAAVCEALSSLLADHVVTESDAGVLDLTQLGYTHSVAGRILNRARELFHWTERHSAIQREGARAEADEILRRAHRDADQHRSSALSESDATRHEAEKVLAEARQEAEATIEIAEELVADARADAGKVAEEILDKASEDARSVTRSATEAAERIRQEAEAEIEQLRAYAVAEAEEIRTKAREEAARRLGEANETAADLLLKAKAAADTSQPSDTAGSIRGQAIDESAVRRREVEEILAKARRQTDGDRTHPSPPTNSERAVAVFTDESSTWRGEVEEILALSRTKREQRHGARSRSA